MPSNFPESDALISTYPQAFTSTFYYLACHPELHDPLRNEIETIVEEEGWTKSAVARMHKLDSVLKEAQRLAGNGVSEYHLSSHIIAFLTCCVSCYESFGSQRLYFLRWYDCTCWGNSRCTCVLPAP